VIVQFVVDLVVLLEVFWATRQDMNVHMLNLDLVSLNLKGTSSKFYYVDFNLNALPGIWTVLNGNVRRRNAVEKFHASLDSLYCEKQIG
jgi:hypothetical protein